MTNTSAQTMLADELIVWVEAYAKKVCPEGCLPTPGQEREINLFARVAVALRAASTPAAVREALVSASEWCQTKAEQIGAVDGYDYRSGEEFGLRSASLELKKRALATPPRKHPPRRCL